MALSQRKKIRLFEVRLWHGHGANGHTSWLSEDEPELVDGSVRFRDLEGFNHVLLGNVEISQVPNRPTRAKPRD